MGKKLAQLTVSTQLLGNVGAIEVAIVRVVR
jgi:hypothetical protein